MSRVAPLLIVTSDYDPGIHDPMATPRWDHRRSNLRLTLSVLLFASLALAFAVAWIAALYLAAALVLAGIAITYVVVYIA